MKIVGVGCGKDMLSQQATAAISEAKRIFGSARAIELAADYIQDSAIVAEITDYKALRSLPEDAVVLSTGDPLMAGLGYLDGEIISGISSLQTAYARLHASWANAAVVNAHGKSHEAAVQQAARDVAAGHSVFIIADPDFSVQKLAEALPRDARIAVCENLGYENEAVRLGDAEHPPAVLAGLFCVVCGY
ncbi:MAG: cobalt-precorrin-7 (C(5))-methyltransferase [Methanocorpusculum sp.]|nr:cobalt-precorrin-7 (C(5))-methyltransferase [Methanocorpusculum sp.]